MAGTHAAGLRASLVDIEAGTTEHDVKVETIDTDRRVVLDAQVDVLLDTEAKVAGVREVVFAQLVLLDLCVRQTNSRN